MSETQVRSMVGRLLREQGDAGHEQHPQTAAPAHPGDALNHEHPGDATIVNIATPCLSAAAPEKVGRTLALLVALDELMADFHPPEPPPVPERPDRCLTNVAARNDPARARDEQAHMREAQMERREAQARARGFADDVRRSRPLYYAWIRGWQGSDLEIREAVYGCRGWCSRYYGDDYSCWTGNSQQSCNDQWAIRLPALQLNRENAELLRRLHSRSDLHPEAEQFCSVVQARVDGGDLVLDCITRGGIFRVRAPVTLAATGAALADVGVGDLVRFAGHLALWKTFERHGWSAESSHWEFWRFEGADLSIIERSTCCAPPPAPTDAGVAAVDAAVTPAAHRHGHHHAM